MAKKGKYRSSVVPVLWATALLYTPLAQAIGLGRLHVESHLGQPLHAEIPLLSVHRGERHSVQAMIASTADFAAAGIQKSRTLRAVHCRVQRNAQGRYEVVLLSRDPVDAPFLHFLLRVKWSDGSLLHEYTALLNPTSGVTTIASGVAPQSMPIAAAASRLRMRESVPRRRLATGPVRAGETLWVVASRAAPNSHAMPQTLEAFLRANPQAFFHHNVNDLRQGVILKIPTRRQILATPPAKAGAWLASQDAAWGHYKTQLAQAPAQANSGSHAVTGSLQAVHVLPASGEALKIVAANLKDRSSGGFGGKTKGMGHGGLGARMQRLQSELRKTRHLMTIENQELALLERQAHVKGHSVQIAAAGTIAKAGSPFKGTVRQAVKTKSLPVRRVVVAPAPLPAPAAPSFLAMLLSSERVPILGALLAIVLGGGALIIRRRRQTMAEFEESILSGGGLNSEGHMADTAGLPKTPDVSFISEFSQAGSAGAMHTDDVDPLAEADVYLAYGRDEQAEEILKEAVMKDGGRLELKLKLLEIYFQRHDSKTFEIVAEEIYAASSGSGPIWKKTEEMGRKLEPSNPLFKGGAEKGDVEKPQEESLVFDEERPLAGGFGDRIDFAAVARELDEVSVPRPQSAGMDMADEGLEWVSQSPQAALPSTTKGPSGLGSASQEATAEESSAEEDVLDFSLDLGRPSELVDGDAPRLPDSASAVKAQAESLDFEWDKSFDKEAPAVMQAADDEFAIQFDEEDVSNLSAADLQLSETSPREERHEKEEGGPLFQILGEEASEDEGDLVLEAVTDSSPSDVVETKLDLARAYLEMGDSEGAREILDEVVVEGNKAQRGLAETLIAGIV